MKIFPLILAGVFISLSLFYYFNQKARIRNEERKDRLKEKKQEYLDALLKAVRKDEDESK